MSILARSSLLTLARPIGQLVPWVMMPLGGSVRLAPMSFFPESWRPERLDVGHVLLLTDLGYLDGHELAQPDQPPPPDRVATEIVLLLPETFLPIVTELRLRAQSTYDLAAVPLFSESWLPTWHHFVLTSDGAPSLENEQLADWSDDQSSFLALNGRRRYVFGSRPGDPSNVPVGRARARPTLVKRLSRSDSIVVPRVHSRFSESH